MGWDRIRPSVKGVSRNRDNYTLHTYEYIWKGRWGTESSLQPYNYREHPTRATMHICVYIPYIWAIHQDKNSRAHDLLIMPLKHLNFQRKVESMHTSIPINGQARERNSSLWMTGPRKGGSIQAKIHHFADLTCQKGGNIHLKFVTFATSAVINRRWSPVHGDQFDTFLRKKQGFSQLEPGKEGSKVSPSHRAPKGRGVIYKAAPGTTSVVLVVIDSRQVIEQSRTEHSCIGSSLELAILKSLFPPSQIHKDTSVTRYNLTRFIQALRAQAQTHLFIGIDSRVKPSWQWRLLFVLH